MPSYDFAALAEEREPYVIVLSYKRENGRIVRDEQGKPIPDDKVVLPPVLPAKLMLRFFNKDREEIKRIADSPTEQFDIGMKVIEELIGKEKWDHVLETIGFNNINPLLTDIMNYYSGGRDDAGEGEEEGETGKAEEPESQSSISSTTSAASTPISNGSTPEPTNVSTISPSGGMPSSPESGTYQPRVSS